MVDLCLGYNIYICTYNIIYYIYRYMGTKLGIFLRLYRILDMHNQQYDNRGSLIPKFGNVGLALDSMTNPKGLKVL